MSNNIFTPSNANGDILSLLNLKADMSASSDWVNTLDMFKNGRNEQQIVQAGGNDDDEDSIANMLAQFSAQRGGADGSILNGLLSSESAANTEDIRRQLKSLFEETEQNGGYGIRVDNQQGGQCGEASILSKSSGQGCSLGLSEDEAFAMSMEGGARVEPEGLKAHRALVTHIQKAMSLPGGPLLQVFASMYKEMARKSNPNMDSIKLAKEAQNIFDNESAAERKNKYQKASVRLAEKKAAKKAARAAK